MLLDRMNLSPCSGSYGVMRSEVSTRGGRRLQTGEERRGSEEGGKLT